MTRLAVVLASFRPPPEALSAVRALRDQCAEAGVPLVVARAWTQGSEEVVAEVPGSTVVRLPDSTSVPELRGAGLGAAEAEWVALTEDNCVADPGWVAAMLRHAGGGPTVLGGVMDNARRRRSVDWGAFFAEYGFYGRAAAEAPAVGFTAANVAYHRSVLARVSAWASAGLWEDVIHARLAAAGAAFAWVPEACVRQNLTYALGAFCRDRYEHGYDYAVVRMARAPAWRRVLRAAAAPVLPGVLAWRVWRRAGRTARGPFWRALPATLAFLSAWAVGEAMGYVRGRPRK